MTLYLDTSALLKLYVDEAESEACERFLSADPNWVSGEHTFVEARRNLARLLSGESLADALIQFATDWQRTAVIGLTTVVCSTAAQIAERTGARTLDALHIAAALQAGVPTVVTYDHRLGAAAEASGLPVATP